MGGGNWNQQHFPQWQMQPQSQQLPSHVNCRSNNGNPSREQQVQTSITPLPPVVRQGPVDIQPAPANSKSLTIFVSGAHTIRIGNYFTMTLERTFRIPDDGKTYPLPPSLGHFPVFRVDDYLDSVPESWKQHGGVFIPMYQREAMWLKFDGSYNRPNAVKVGVGKVNAISGKPWSNQLTPGENDYLVVPDQPWLDGINGGDGLIKQFVAMPLGMGYTVEGHVTGKEEFGGLQLIVFDSKPGMMDKHLKNFYADRKKQKQSWSYDDDNDNDEREDYECNIPLGKTRGSSARRSKPKGGRALEMGLAAGAKMKQKIYEDKYGIDAWDQEASGGIYIHIVNSDMFYKITKKTPPPSPISAKTYSSYGYPWFDLYDEDTGYVNSVMPNPFTSVQSVKQMDQQMFASPQQDDSTVNISSNNIITYNYTNSSSKAVRDGDW